MRFATLALVLLVSLPGFGSSTPPPSLTPTDLSLFQPAPAAQCSAFGLTPAHAEREFRAAVRARIALVARVSRDFAQPTRRRPKMTAPALPAVVAASFQPPASISSMPTERKYRLYLPDGMLLAESEWSTAGDLAIQYEYVWFGDEPLAMIETATNKTYHFLNDHLGTPVAMTDQQGQLVWRAEYDPMGNIYVIRLGETLHQPLRFPGQLADENTSTYYNVHRYYRPSWGRYTQPDPIGFDGGDLHIYRYSGGNPLSNIDPLGLDFTNNSSRPVCAIKGGAWSVVKPTETLKGDVDAVAAPKGQVWGVPPKTNRVFKWIDCFHATLTDIPGKTPFVGISLTKQAFSDINDLPFLRACACIGDAEGQQRQRGGPVPDFGNPPATCP